MHLLNSQFNLDRFWEAVRHSKQPVLLSDYDGTLSPLVIERDKALMYAGVESRLQKIIAETKTRLVIISGRWSRDLLHLIKLDPFPEVWGCHGAERLFPDGRHHQVSLSEKAMTRLQEAREWVKSEGLQTRTEDKPISIAFHWRGLNTAHIEQVATRIKERWGGSSDDPGLELLEFDGGLELRAPGITKAVAIQEIMNELESSTPLAYLGDDQTDEEAMAAMTDTQLKVLVRRELRKTAADLHVVPPQELLDFLDAWYQAAG